MIESTEKTELDQKKESQSNLPSMGEETLEAAIKQKSVIEPSSASKLVRRDDPSKIKTPSVAKRNLTIIFDYLKTFFVIIIEILVVLLLVTFVIVPQYNKYLELSTKVESKEGELQIISAQKDYLKSLSSLDEALPQNILVAEQALPVSDSEIPYFLNQLLYMAEKANVNVDEQAYIGISEEGADDDVQIVDVPGSEDLFLEDGLPSDLPDAFYDLENSLMQAISTSKKIVIKMSVSGRYEDLIAFLEKVEKSRRIFVVEEMSLEINEDSSKKEPSEEKLENNYSLKMTINGFFLPEVSASGLSVETLVSKPRLENVIKYISELDYYDLDVSNIKLGKDNPFDESTDEVADTINPEETGIIEDVFEGIEPED